MLFAVSCLSSLDFLVFDVLLVFVLMVFVVADAWRQR
jgi:hypothetical protein